MMNATPDGKVALQIVLDKHVQRAKNQSGISKAWLNDLINKETIPDRRIVLQEVFDKLTESPNKTDRKPKVVDHNKVYEKVLLYYIENGKTPDEAHEIAQRIVEEQ